MKREWVTSEAKRCTGFDIIGEKSILFVSFMLGKVKNQSTVKNEN